MISQWLLLGYNMVGMNEVENFFMSEIESALVPLIECINENYDPNYSSHDLQISYDPKRKISMSYGGRIVFSKVQGWNHGGLEYKMFENDADLWTHGINSLEFRAWWLTAHEISHEIYGRIFGQSVGWKTFWGKKTRRFVKFREMSSTARQLYCWCDSA